ncbi:MarR family transcriptional regulator/GNAT family N-acetyltransferase [Fulvivirga lutea]|uniref:MarR family transcriptional regulator/GNAT family N-acetyltransferase n=2 Tax=Fulvivirga lutea TaxID=2810512 RepID=A0A974WPQ4_9BACT|nr:MarR family transcriptional regulator/GNAT family N-acetyltransferase [Fulvivirga lutea]
MEISEKIGISHPYVIKLVKELQRAGLVTNTTNSNDARKRSIELSTDGRKLLNSITPIWNDIHSTIEDLLRDSNNSLYSNLIALENSFTEESFLNRVFTTRKQRLLEEVEILPYNPSLKEHFKTLNIEWLEKYFTVEPIDVKVLSEPEENIIKPGGAIVFARVEGKIVGTCALKKKEGYGYELTKMAVTESAQGLQIGKKLGLEIISIAKTKKAKLVFLESNRILTPAIALYRNLGFIEGITPWESDYQRSNIYMELKL